MASFLLLCGCTGPEDLSDLLGAPSVSLGDRPGYKPDEVSGMLEEDPSYASQPSKRNMGLEETEAVGLYRVITRTGDLSVLGMIYGDGTYFVLSQRERGYFVTGYGEDKKGIFSGMLNEEYTSPALLGYAGGFACLYCPESDLTLACRGDGSYLQFRREDADAVWLFDGGYAMQRGQEISLYAPDKKDPKAVFTLPEGYTWVDGNENGAWVEKDGTVSLLSADGRLSGGLSSHLSVQEGGYLCKSDSFSVVLNPLQGVAYAARNLSSLWAVGGDYTMENTSAGLRITMPEIGKTALLPKGKEFTFGGRTEKGFLYAVDGVWYWFASTAMTDFTPDAMPFASSDDPLAVAALCAKNALSAQIGKTLHTETVVRDGLSAAGVADNGVLFDACAALIDLLKNQALPAESLFLCSALNVDGQDVPYAITEGELFLDVSDPKGLEEQLQALFAQPEEEIQG